MSRLTSIVTSVAYLPSVQARLSVSVPSRPQFSGEWADLYLLVKQKILGDRCPGCKRTVDAPTAWPVAPAVRHGLQDQYPTPTARIAQDFDLAIPSCPLREEIL
jgi:hypothetical protein